VSLKHLSRRTSAYPGSAGVLTHRTVRADARQAKLRWLAKQNGCQFAPSSFAQAARRPYQHLLRQRRACTSSSRAQVVHYSIVPRADFQLASQTMTLHFTVLRVLCTTLPSTPVAVPQTPLRPSPSVQPDESRRFLSRCPNSSAHPVGPSTHQVGSL
jgi:hypothetical protein